MSLALVNSGGIDCKSFSGFGGRGFFENQIRIADKFISVIDFNEVIMYYLTNTDLEPNDSRLELIDRIKKLHQVDGWNIGNSRLGEYIK